MEQPKNKMRYLPPPPVPQNRSLSYLNSLYLRENMLDRGLLKHNPFGLQAELPWNTVRHNNFHPWTSSQASQ